MSDSQAPPALSPQNTKPTRAGWLVFLLILMGTCGVGQGMGEVEDKALPERSTSSNANAKMSVIFAEALWQDPYRRPLAAANILVSFMFMWSGLLLAFGARSARWWTMQSTLANALWALAAALAQGRQLMSSHKSFVEIVRIGPWFSSKAESSSTPSAAELSELASQAMVLSLVFVGLQFMARGLLYFLIFRRVTRLPVPGPQERAS